MSKRILLPTVLLLLSLPVAPAAAAEHEVRVLDPGYHHLGNDPTPEWTEASAEPEGKRLELSFEARANAGENVLIVAQRSVNDTWHVEINGRRVLVLDREDALADHTYTIPPGTLVDGENRLVLVPDQPADDITFGNVRLIAASLREALDLRVVTVAVTDADGGRPVPARITILDPEDALVTVYNAESATTAVREGVVYTATGGARFELPPGAYEIYATRGAEWGLGRALLTVDSAEQHAHLSMRREVDTTGFIACDTHIHTLTFSGHGDSSVEERMVTLAAEGVELAVSTDHNHNTDYRPYQERMELTEHFTPVVGNEVTTPIGHLNAFPLDPADEVPPYDLRDWIRIVEGIRDRGAEVVILNHPRWPAHDTGPFGVFGLDHLTGEIDAPLDGLLDAMELVNSTTEEETPFLLFSDWFALMNSGERVKAVGSSDSHTVGDPVGQGRTYVRSHTDDPAEIDVEAAARNIVEGRSSIGMGIFVDVRVGERFAMGDVAPVEDGALSVTLRVQAPSWIRPERAILFVNGAAVEEIAVRAAEGVPTDERIPFDVRLEAAHDAWVVCVVTGAGVREPWWPTLNDYTLAATNPVFLDVDGDGIYRSPREVARTLLERTGPAPERIAAGLAGVDEAVALQLLHLAHESYLREARAKLRAAAEGGIAVHGRIAEFLDSLEGQE